MLQISNISKQYQTADLIQTALDQVSLNLRDNEFVAILGPSGSGKTTLLNIIGGLDRYDSGDLIINGISTRKYKDRDWDAYRNHTIGFVFQSYNLIPHQSVLANVELALTISGISGKERRNRATHALEQVGLEKQIHKRPNQLSGGQMQRVAIARALVNDPDILLADEPTGALDSETSIQVMDLLKEVAKDRLVVMVTHNPELADRYANRIVSLRDGHILSDSNPYMPESATAAPVHKRIGRASMSFATALSLSFQNLRTKKARTFLTAFAGSIGIICISLILSLSNGVNRYITDMQKSIMTAYPVTLESSTVDYSSLFGQKGQTQQSEDTHEDSDSIFPNIQKLQKTSNATITNNLSAFKAYLEQADCPINSYVGKTGIVYSYDTQFSVYTYDADGKTVNMDGSSLTQTTATVSGSIMGGNTDNTGSTEGMSASGGLGSLTGTTSSPLGELIPDASGAGVSEAVTDNYQLLYGSWPTAYNEMILVVDSQQELSVKTLYELGMISTSEYKQVLQDSSSGKEISLSESDWSYERICSQTFYLLPACDTYVQQSGQLYRNIAEGSQEFDSLLGQAVSMKITGIVQKNADSDNATISSTLGYTHALTDYLADHANSSAVVQAQQNDPQTNVLTGKAFQDGTTAQDNLKTFGAVDEDSPSSISIYADSFEDKQSIENEIDAYNANAAEEDRITYTDYVALLMSSVTKIVNVITYVLVAFVAVSLVVSSIMIGIITYISVLERTKEIGILRAMGASKHNISQVFNAETFIIGLCSGVLGVGIASLLLIPGNQLIHKLTGITTVNASLPVTSALFLIGLSMLLTILAGLIPSGKASRKDPVIALRTE